ncbi:hypothetical protein [Iningainema tapete]|uniref:Uncharacterized protein n=1 Tax=Iningainema tapete BLCC-T55 TaxID=2748662 RepID=A0A8J6XKE2_9CYAN|nr:hypothetical protein [Iningainema tapete]MBD2777804.1 hypothetical protein [Iningainema tapete BLCC-T55]
MMISPAIGWLVGLVDLSHVCSVTTVTSYRTSLEAIALLQQLFFASSVSSLKFSRLLFTNML